MLNRDECAFRLLELFLSNQATKCMTILDRIKLFLGFGSWKQRIHYNYEDAVKNAYECADIFMQQANQDKDI